MEEKFGIKETKEAICGILELSLAIAGVLRDGAQVTDLGTLLALFRESSEFKAKLEAAVQGSAKVPAEVSDLHLKEGLELTTEVIAFIPRFVDVFLKKGL